MQALFYCQGFGNSDTYSDTWTVVVICKRFPALSEETDRERNTAERTIPAAERPLRFLRIRDIVELIGLSKSTIYSMQARGLFPKRVKLTEHTSVWVESEVHDWMRSRVESARRDL